MQVLFIIGGMGSGKSTVSRMLGDSGLPVLDLDKVGHRALQDRVIKHSLADAFGHDILDKNGEVLRGVLAKKAFMSSRTTELLNVITRPWIYQQMHKWLEEEDKKETPFVAVEVSALNHPDELRKVGFANMIIAVVASFEVRKKRAEANGFDPADISERMLRQRSDAKRRQWADFVIENEGTVHDLRLAIEALMEKIRR